MRQQQSDFVAQVQLKSEYALISPTIHRKRIGFGKGLKIRAIKTWEMLCTCARMPGASSVYLPSASGGGTVPRIAAAEAEAAKK